MFSTNVTKTLWPFMMSSHLCFAGSHFSEHSVYTRCVCVVPPLRSGSGPDRFQFRSLSFHTGCRCCVSPVGRSSGDPEHSRENQF